MNIDIEDLEEYISSEKFEKIVADSLNSLPIHFISQYEEILVKWLLHKEQKTKFVPLKWIMLHITLKMDQLSRIGIKLIDAGSDVTDLSILALSCKCSEEIALKIIDLASKSIDYPMVISYIMTYRDMLNQSMLMMACKAKMNKLVLKIIDMITTKSEIEDVINDVYSCAKSKKMDEVIDKLIELAKKFNINLDNKLIEWKPLVIDDITTQIEENKQMDFTNIYLGFIVIVLIYLMYIIYQNYSIKYAYDIFMIHSTSVLICLIVIILMGSIISMILLILEDHLTKISILSLIESIINYAKMFKKNDEHNKRNDKTTQSLELEIAYLKQRIHNLNAELNDIKNISKSPYEELGITKDESKKTITKVYHMLSLIYHPDRKIVKSEHKFKCILNAYEKLS